MESNNKRTLLWTGLFGVALSLALFLTLAGRDALVAEAIVDASFDASMNVALNVDGIDAAWLSSGSRPVKWCKSTSSC